MLSRRSRRDRTRLKAGWAADSHWTARASAKRRSIPVSPRTKQLRRFQCSPHSQSSLERVHRRGSVVRYAPAGAVRRERWRLLVASPVPHPGERAWPIEMNSAGRIAKPFRALRFRAFPRDTSSGVWSHDRCGSTNGRPRASDPFWDWRDNRRPRAQRCTIPSAQSRPRGNSPRLLIRISRFVSTYVAPVMLRDTSMLNL